MFARRIASLSACFALVGAASLGTPPALGQAPAKDAGVTSTAPVVQQGPAGTAPRSEPATPAAAGDVTSPALPIATRYAYFVPARFDELPGWRTDEIGEAWKAFRASCSVLASRSAWSGACRRAARVGARNDDVRRFIEREFTLYQIHNKDQSPAGVITGYYEPLLHGSRRYGEPYVYPVYGVPPDLLYLDSRSIPRNSGGLSVFARIEGRAVIPVCAEAVSDPSCRGPYVLDVAGARPDIRDKRLRVRVDGQRIVPYYTRAEIEQGALAAGPVIVWVDNLAALYSMQVQGSGKVLLPDGQIVRLAYGEQNGHPFNPPVQKARMAHPRGPAVLTRGIELPGVDSSDDAEDDDEGATPMGDAGAPLLRGGPAPAPAGRQTTPPPADTGEALSAEVAHMVELLLKGTEAQGPQRVPVDAAANAKSEPSAAAATLSATKSSPPSGNDKRPAAAPAPALAKAAPAPGNAKAPASEPAPTIAKSAAAPLLPSVAASAPALAAPAPPSALAGPHRPSPFSVDPSYVFFRQIPDDDGGPLGALGVPLTPGRSVAVDPRTTPLGAPVFIATTGPNPGNTVSRLMLAQDTGGAIRGAVRADYFWGFGPTAGERASRMKEYGRMWLLLPHELAASAGATGFLTRGGGDAECLIPDPDLCVE